MLYIRSSELTHLKTGSLYPLTKSPHFPKPPASGNHHSTLYFCEWLFKDSTYRWENTGFVLSLSDWFHLAQYLQGPSILLQMAGFPSLYGWIVFHYIHIHTHIHTPYFLYQEITVNGHLGCSFTINRYLGCFHMLAIMNNAAMNIGI